MDNKIYTTFFVDTDLDSGQSHLLTHLPKKGDFVNFGKQDLVVKSRVFAYESGSAPRVYIYLSERIQ